MSVEAQAWAWKQEIHDSKKLVLLALADHCDNRGVCWPSVATIIEKTMLGRSTVKMALKILMERGLIRISTRVRENGSDTSNWYVLRLPDNETVFQRVLELSNEPEGPDIDPPRGQNLTPGGPESGPPEPSIEPSDRKHGRFAPPIQEDVTNYWAAEKLDGSPEEFFDYHQAKGWIIGRVPMKDWRAAARNWSRRQFRGASAPAAASSSRSEVRQQQTASIGKGADPEKSSLDLDLEARGIEKLEELVEKYGSYLDPRVHNELQEWKKRALAASPQKEN